MRLLASSRLAALTLVAVIAASGCSEGNPNFCEQGTQCIDAADVPIDAPDVEGCVANPSVCMAPDLTCVMDRCRDCDTSMTSNVQSGDCTVAALPVCGAGNACRACTSHEECTSGVCFDGTCPTAPQVLYVAPNGNNGGGNQCTNIASPCQTLSHAITTQTPTIGADINANRRFIRLLAAGDYAEPGAVPIDDRAVWIIGPPGASRAVIDRSGNGPTLVVQNASQVRLEGIAVNNGSNNTAADGITCAGSTLVADGIEVHSNDGTGIVADGCELTVSRSVISQNVEGGISANGGLAVIVNNTIVENGGSNSSFGGVYLMSGVGSTSVLQSNTIVNNDSSGIAEADGIDCRVSGVVARNNIVFGSGTRPRVVGDCTHQFTLYGPTDLGAPLGALNGNMLVLNDADFRFQSAATRNYHLQTGTPASVAKDKGTATGIAPEAETDIDREPRPQGTTDVGCDEIP